MIVSRTFSDNAGVDRRVLDALKMARILERRAEAGAAAAALDRDLDCELAGGLDCGLRDLDSGPDDILNI